MKYTVKEGTTTTKFRDLQDAIAYANHSPARTLEPPAETRTGRHHNGHFATALFNAVTGGNR